MWYLFEYVSVEKDFVVNGEFVGLVLDCEISEYDFSQVVNGSNGVCPLISELSAT